MSEHGLPLDPPNLQNSIARAAWHFLRIELRAIGDDFSADAILLEEICALCARGIDAERSLRTCASAARDVYEEIRVEAWDIFREFADDMLLALDVRVRLLRAIAPDLEIDVLQLFANHAREKLQ